MCEKFRYACFQFDTAYKLKNMLGHSHLLATISVVASQVKDISFMPKSLTPPMIWPAIYNDLSNKRENYDIKINKLKIIQLCCR